jgi:Ricin-type beta-trefoil lectin domain-like
LSTRPNRVLPLQGKMATRPLRTWGSACFIVLSACSFHSLGYLEDGANGGHSAEGAAAGGSLDDTGNATGNSMAGNAVGSTGDSGVEAGALCQAGVCATLTNNATYVLHPSDDTTKCADDRGRSLFNGASVIQYACNAQPGQVFAALDRSDGYFAFKNVLNGRCLEVAGSKLTANAATDLYTCSFADNQLWQVSTTSAGFFKLVAKHSGMALDVYGAQSTLSDLPLVQNNYDGSLDMQWRLELTTN